MPLIVNPTPQTLGRTDGMWVTKMILRLDGGDCLIANLLPYDGQHLAALGGKSVFKKLSDIREDLQVDSLLDVIVAKVKQMAGTTEDVLIVDVKATDPRKPVLARIRFANTPRTFDIIDCFATCGTDPQFAQIFMSMMGLIATLAGLEIQ